MTRVFHARRIFLMLNLTKEVEEALRPVKGALYITVGNNIRADDGVGPYVYSGIKDVSGITAVDAGGRPENIIFQCENIKPSKIIIIDAANFNGRPGEVRVIDADKINLCVMSTHTFPLAAVAKLLEQDTGVKVLFIGIQPANAVISEKLSPEVEQSADKIIECIVKAGSRL